MPNRRPPRDDSDHRRQPPVEPPHRAPRRTSPAPRRNRQGTMSGTILRRRDRTARPPRVEHYSSAVKQQPEGPIMGKSLGKRSAPGEGSCKARKSSHSFSVIARRRRSARHRFRRMSQVLVRLGPIGGCPTSSRPSSTPPETARRPSASRAITLSRAAQVPTKTWMLISRPAATSSNETRLERQMAQPPLSFPEGPASFPARMPLTIMSLATSTSLAFTPVPLATMSSMVRVPALTFSRSTPIAGRPPAHASRFRSVRPRLAL